MPENETSLDAIAADCQAFIQSFQTVILSTLSAAGLPEASYAPCVRQDGRFYIYVSELANHTRNLLAFPQASLLFIEPEAEARNLFARKRVTLEVTVQPIERGSEPWEQVLALMQQQLGNTLAVIRELKDFHLLALTPQRATYVTGFAKAYRLEGPELAQVSHLGGK